MWFSGLGLKTGGGVWWCTWHHHGACVEVKQRREGPEGVQATRKEMDKFALGGSFVSRLYSTDTTDDLIGTADALSNLSIGTADDKSGAVDACSELLCFECISPIAVCLGCSPLLPLYSSTSRQFLETQKPEWVLVDLKGHDPKMREREAKGKFPSCPHCALLDQENPQIALRHHATDRPPASASAPSTPAEPRIAAAAARSSSPAVLWRPLLWRPPFSPSGDPMTMMTPPPLEQQQEDEEMLVPHQELPAADAPQPMEVVAQTEPVSTAESQPAEDPQTSRFTWTIENFSRLNTKKHYSDVFVVGGYKWRVLIFPKGNNVDHLSMYLDVADSGNLPYGWSRYAQFSLAVVNQIHPKYTIRKDTQHQFNARESDWGFTSFMPLSELYDPSRGYLLNDIVIVEAEVAVRRMVDYWTYDSKKETGYVGLKNQGATCYMNSLLQTLYHIPYFRKAVYHMPTTENDMPSGSIPLALQSLFYKLQYSDNSVATKELTKSFGWDTYDSFMQHDVQELNRVLCEKLEDKMKGTVVEGTIEQLFEGHHINYIECINVEYKSSRKESFYDLQLDVKGCRDVYASFDKYVEVERLEGDNKYHAEQYGLQDAKKGVLFLDFPPVLQLQLKRFEYDYMRDTMVKINDRYEFPLQLDLDRENGKYLSPDADRSIRNLYTLHRYKFDDERVTKEDTKKALEEQYGGEEELPQINPGFNNTPFKFTKYSNAYMLVYIRESDKEKIMCNVDEKDIAEHLRIRLKKEQEEKEHKKKEKAEAHLYTVIKIARDEDLKEQIGKNIYFDLVDHEKVRSFRIQKQLPFTSFKEEVAKEYGIPVQFQRFWLWAKRQNHTYRPNRPLTPVEEAQSVGQLREVSNKAHNAELKLFLEVERSMSNSSP
ncbi:hypothetical protein PR202_ga12416 [Eleusine coracana subsp. coracana]|uniref:ubiquitinyl hydrolase 1 n=1 Tax=Eleusine coracana subsp. coracana TaxID=191504 RepID=A0AAV5CC08_ELECO|nr:hypothetical protein PR202_ga12416 [Eleusine coracana subsp. coracana]